MFICSSSFSVEMIQKRYTCDAERYGNESLRKLSLQEEEHTVLLAAYLMGRGISTARSHVGARTIFASSGMTCLPDTVPVISMRT
jgi:hypothetical protein